jgi:hypothetical protein
VTAPGTANIDRLKELVREKGALRNVDARDLDLWKVKTFLEQS